MFSSSKYSDECDHSLNKYEHTNVSSHIVVCGFSMWAPCIEFCCAQITKKSCCVFSFFFFFSPSDNLPGDGVNRHVCPHDETRRYMILHWWSVQSFFILSDTRCFCFLCFYQAAQWKNWKKHTHKLFPFNCLKGKKSLIEFSSLHISLWIPLFFFFSEAALACLSVDPAVMLMVVGVLMFIITFCGCVGSLRENICLLQIVSMKS